MHNSIARWPIQYLEWGRGFLKIYRRHIQPLMSYNVCVVGLRTFVTWQWHDTVWSSLQTCASIENSMSYLVVKGRCYLFTECMKSLYKWRRCTVIIHVYGVRGIRHNNRIFVRHFIVVIPANRATNYCSNNSDTCARPRLSTSYTITAAQVNHRTHRRAIPGSNHVIRSESYACSDTAFLLTNFRYEH